MLIGFNIAAVELSTMEVPYVSQIALQHAYFYAICRGKLSISREQDGAAALQAVVSRLSEIFIQN